MKYILPTMMLMALALQGQEPAQEVSTREVVFIFTTETQNYEVHIREDGTGFYWDQSMPVPVTDSDRAKLMIRIGAEQIRHALAASPAIRKRDCETKLHNIARTGRKTLQEYFVFQDPTINSAFWTCDYNYSDDPDVNQATEMFQAIANTMQIGEELARLHRFDRLGLDAEIDILTGALKDGRALEAINIEPVLKSIAEDERVMERVRRKATRLLVEAGVEAVPVK